MEYQRGRDIINKTEEKKRTEFRESSINKNRDIKTIPNERE
jgi:hypothetical protein